jgi:predicted membrane channel-forming protein YqfA (hemolysin III family)
LRNKNLQNKNQTESSEILNQIQMKKLAEYQKFIYLGIVVIALGIVFTTSLRETAGYFGNVLVAIGGLLFIVGMSKKKRSEKDTD